MKKKLEKVNDVEARPRAFVGLTNRYGTTGKAYDPSKPISNEEMEKLVGDFGAKDPDLIQDPEYTKRIQADMMREMGVTLIDSSIKYMADNDLTFGELWGDEAQSNKIQWARSLISLLAGQSQDENEIYFYAVWLASIKGI